MKPNQLANTQPKANPQHLKPISNQIGPKSELKSNQVRPQPNLDQTKYEIPNQKVQILRSLLKKNMSLEFYQKTEHHTTTIQQKLNNNARSIDKIPQLRPKTKTS